MAIKKSSGSGIPSGNNAGRPANPGIGQLYSNGETARLELFTQASGWQNIVQETPGVSSITGNYLESTNSGVITISGTNFVSGAYATAIGTNGVQVDASSTTFNSLVQITATFTGLVGANEPYDIKVTNPSNLFGMLPDALYVNNNPAWTTPAGSLGSFAEQVNATIYALSISDESTITYSLAAGSSLPSGVTLSSAGVISGTLPDVASNTTYTFTVNATDGLNPLISRTFSFVSNASPIWSTESGSLGTFSKNTSISLTVAATDVSDSITYALASGSTLPSGITLNSSTGLISGTLPNITTDTTYTFTINASDGINPSVPRSFSINSMGADFDMDYLVVGGGGGAGYDNGGGGGGGGLRSSVGLTGGGGAAESKFRVVLGTPYSISVGIGGRGTSDTLVTTVVSSGNPSSFATITALGGGRGGISADGSNGISGGSGGGAKRTSTAGAGTPGQGFPGGGGNNGYTGAGGGGAGQAGQAATASAGGKGGDGLAISITGSSVYYAGGGGGGYENSNQNNGGAGGLGGGGNGGARGGTYLGGNGTNGLGGGGGGTEYLNGSSNVEAGMGGSGVVILKYASNRTPTISGGLTSTTSTAVSGFKITTFTVGTGTITF